MEAIAQIDAYAILVRYHEGQRLLHNPLRWERVPRIMTWGDARTQEEAHTIADNLRSGNRGIITVVCLWGDRFNYTPE